MATKFIRSYGSYVFRQNGKITPKLSCLINTGRCFDCQVVEEGDMVTARRAYIAEKSWSKLAHHFAVLLSDKDTEVLTRLQAHMEK